MLGHEFFHEQAHLEKHHELKRRIFLVVCLSILIINSQLSTLNSQLLLALVLALIYRFFCHRQEYEADRIAAKKCGKKAAIESLKLLPPSSRFFSLHPSTKARISHLR